MVAVAFHRPPDGNLPPCGFQGVGQVFVGTDVADAVRRSSASASHGYEPVESDVFPEFRAV